MHRTLMAVGVVEKASQIYLGQAEVTFLMAASLKMSTKVG